MVTARLCAQGMRHSIIAYIKIIARRRMNVAAPVDMNGRLTIISSFESHS